MRSAPLTLALLASVSALAFACGDAAAKSSGNSSFSGGIQIGVSTDRNAGSSGGVLRSSSSREDDDEDEDADSDDDDDDDFADDDDLLDDLDLEDDDDVAAIEDELDDDGDADGDGIVDGTESDDSDGDGITDGEEAAAGTDAGAGDLAVDEAALSIRRAGKAAAKPKTVRDERLTLKANIGHKYKLGKSGHTWKSGMSYTSANQRDLDKNDNYIMALSTGPEFKLMKGDLTVSPQVAYARLSKDSKHIFDTYAALLGAKYKINKSIAVKGKYTYSEQNFSSSKLDEVYGQKWAAALDFKPFKHAAAEIGGAFKTVDTTPASKEKDQRELHVKYQHDLPWKFYALGLAGYKWTDYDVAASSRVPVRKDEEATVGLSLGREIYKKVTLELQYDHRDTNTNIRNKDSSNDRFALVGSWKF